MNNYIECEININGSDVIFKRKSLGCYDIYLNNMIAFENIDKDSDEYTPDLKQIKKHINKLTIEESNTNISSSIKKMEELSTNIGFDECRFMLDKRLSLKLSLALKSIGMNKKNFINTAIAEKLEREGLL